MVNKLGLKQPPNRTARSMDEGIKLAEEIGYPLVVRPSYVLGAGPWRSSTMRRNCAAT